jgi:hypothetical protein
LLDSRRSGLESINEIFRQNIGPKGAIMRIVRGQARSGKVELDLPGVVDGESVTAVILDQQPVVLTAAERDSLVRSIASGEIDDGLDALEALEAFEQEEWSRRSG